MIKGSFKRTVSILLALVFFQTLHVNAMEGGSVETQASIKYSLNNENIVSGSTDWVYFSNITGEEQADNWTTNQFARPLPLDIYTKGIYKVNKKDTSKVYKVNNDNAKDINYSNGWLYYGSAITQYSDHLFSINPDGGDERLVAEDKIQDYIIKDNTAYYMGYLEPASLFSKSLDSAQKLALKDSTPSWGIDYDIKVFGDYIVYKNYQNIVVAKKDGTIQKVIPEKALVLYDFDGTWIYYHDSEGYFYRIKIDGTSKTLIASGFRTFLNSQQKIFYGDTIYYIKAANLYSVKKDGTQNTALTTMVANLIGIENGWIYYRPCESYSDSGGIVFTKVKNSIYKCTLDGKNVTKVFDETSFEKISDDVQSNAVEVQDGWIYYINNSDYKNPNNLYKIKTDGTSNTKMTDFKVNSFSIIENWIYFSNFSDGDRLYKMALDGSSVTKLSDKEAINISFYNGRIYFKNSSVSNKLIKVKADGSGRQKLFDGNVTNVLVKDNWVYFINMTDNFRIYRMTTDGKNISKLSDDSVRSMVLTATGIFYIKGLLSGSMYSNSNIAKMNFDGSNRSSISNEIYLRKAKEVNGWVYFLNPLDMKEEKAYPLYRARTDGTGLACISSENVLNFEVKDNLVYYTTLDDGYIQSIYQIRNKHMYKQQVDGSGKTLISGIQAEFLNIYNDRVYYIDEITKSLMQMPIGNEAQRNVVLPNVVRFKISGDNLVYVDSVYAYINRINLMDNSKQLYIAYCPYYSFDTDGVNIYYQDTNKNIIVRSLASGVIVNSIACERAASELHVDGDFIVYSMMTVDFMSEHEYPYKGYICGINSSTPTLISDQMYNEEITLRDNYVYFIKRANGTYEYDRMNLSDKSTSTLKTKYSCANFTISGNKIYFSDNNGYVYREELDGSNVTKVLNEKVSSEGFSLLGNYIFFTKALEYGCSSIYYAELGQAAIQQVNSISSSALSIVDNLLFFKSEESGKPDSTEFIRLEIDSTTKKITSFSEPVLLNTVTPVNRDFNVDGKIDILDLAILSSQYNSRIGERNWNAIFDLNKDGITDIYDLVEESILYFGVRPLGKNGKSSAA